MPIADRTSKALLNFSGGQDGQQTPTYIFPSFLPLETFDNTDFDCRTPEEWLALGEESDDTRKPVPGKALLPVLPPPRTPTTGTTPIVVPTQLIPTPPRSHPPHGSTNHGRTSFRK